MLITVSKNGPFLGHPYFSGFSCFSIYFSLFYRFCQFWCKIPPYGPQKMALWVLPHKRKKVQKRKNVLSTVRIFQNIKIGVFLDFQKFTPVSKNRPFFGSFLTQFMTPFYSIFSKTIDKSLCYLTHAIITC